PPGWNYLPSEVVNNVSVGMGHDDAYWSPLCFVLRAGGQVTRYNYNFDVNKAYHFKLTLAYGNQLTCSVYDGATRLCTMMLMADFSSVTTNSQMAVFSGDGSFELTTMVQNVDIVAWDPAQSVTSTPPGWARSEQRPLPTTVVKTGATAPDVKVDFDMSVNYNQGNDMGGYFSLYNPAGSFTPPTYWYQYPTEVTNYLTVSMEGYYGPRFGLRAGGAANFLNYNFTADKLYHFTLTIANGSQITCAVYDGSTLIGTLFLNQDISSIMSNDQMAVYSGSGSYLLTTSVQNLNIRTWDAALTTTNTPPGWARSEQRSIPSLILKNGATTPNARVEWDMSVNYNQANDMGGYFSLYTPAGSFTPPGSWNQYPAEVTNYLTVSMEGYYGPRFGLRAGGASAFLNYNFTPHTLYHFVLTVTGGNQIACTVYDGATSLGTMSLTQDISGIMANPMLATYAGSGSYNLTSTVKSMVFSTW
ncbi:MAG: hypothetical protein ACYDBB_17385, partial [Armatimonadota bacterium]